MHQEWWYHQDRCIILTKTVDRYPYQMHIQSNRSEIDPATFSSMGRILNVFTNNVIDLFIIWMVYATVLVVAPGKRS